MTVIIEIMSNHLYHFFPRKFENKEKSISIVTSIFENGPFLSKEKLEINWKDPYAVNGLQRKLDAEQMRFCLTAISNDTELKAHSNKFGSIGLEFNEEFIVKIGGFPVFYVPTPLTEDASKDEYKGISLLYRLADAQQIFEYIIKHNLIQTKDIELENVLGAIKFLANICYPTQQSRNLNKIQVNYYNQREWRIIYNLTPANVKIGYHENNHTIEAFNDEPLRNFITKIIVFKNPNISEEICQCILKKIDSLIKLYGMKCELEQKGIDSN